MYDDCFPLQGTLIARPAEKIKFLKHIYSSNPLKKCLILGQTASELLHRELTMRRPKTIYSTPIPQKQQSNQLLKWMKSRRKEKEITKALTYDNWSIHWGYRISSPIGNIYRYYPLELWNVVLHLGTCKHNIGDEQTTHLIRFNWNDSSCNSTRITLNIQQKCITRLWG